jgi:hypothetical protein
MAGNNVPGLDSTPQLSENVPGVQFPFRQEFGKVGEALQGVGESIAHTGAKVGEIYDEVQRQHDISTSSKNYVDAGIAHAQQLQNLKLTSPDGFIHDQNTGEVIQNSDGSQRTISQEYWDYADKDYQDRQDTMSPRAAAMFRQQMQPEIGQNTKIMQNTQMQLQHDDSLNSLKQNQTTLARDNDRTPYPDQNAYYQQANADGSMNLRPSTDKISDQLRTLQVQIAQKGPVNNAPGAFTPGEVHNLTTSTLSEHSDSWMRSAVTDVLENDTPRDKKNKISTTAVQQVLNLRDIVEGKDPQSQQALQKNMPTVNSTLNAAQIDKWRDQLNGMLDGAKKIDRSDYDFQLQQMKDFSKSGKLDTPDKLFGSPQFQYLVHAADPLGLTPEEQLKNFSDIFTNAAGSSYGGASFDLSSDASKRTQIMNKIDAYAKAWPQYGQMLGAKFTGTMADALKSEVTKGALSKLGLPRSDGEDLLPQPHDERRRRPAFPRSFHVCHGQADVQRQDRYFECRSNDVPHRCPRFWSRL